MQSIANFNADPRHRSAMYLPPHAVAMLARAYYGLPLARTRAEAQTRTSLRKRGALENDTITEKGIRVLAEQVAKRPRPLCVGTPSPL